jgi:uncharacterized protein (DUF305 family)
LKTPLRKAWLPALILAVAFNMVACGDAGGGDGGGQQGSGSGGDGEQGTAEKAGGMGRMDRDQMGHGSMGMGSGGMARQMVMENGKYSDKAFIDAMVPHHQGAIDMAEIALKNAEHVEIKQLSENIISTQRAEIKELESIKKEEFGTSEVPMEMGAEDMQMMGITDPDELANKDLFDKAFIDAMIPHHQSAIDMAKIAYEKSEHPRIKELAENIVSAQQEEIEEMKRWRQRWYSQG